jgi:hypothetical protein
VGLEKSARGSVRGPGSIHTLNLSLYKTSRIGRATLRLGAQVYNATNTPSFSLGTASALAFSGGPAETATAFVIPGSPQFLKANSFSGSLSMAPYQRIVQLEARLTF